MFENIVISIIFPVKLPCDYFTKTLESIQNQNFNNFELIIIHAGTFNKIQENLLKLSHFSWYLFPEIDKGVYQAMNLGIKKSKGIFLYFIGSGDELIGCDILEKIAIILRNSRIDVLFGNVLTQNKIYPGLYFDIETIFKGSMVCHQGVFMRKESILNLKCFDLKYPIASDFDLIYRALKNGANTIFVNILIAKYLGGGISDKNTSIYDISSSLYKQGNKIYALKFLIVEYLAIHYRKYFKNILKWFLTKVLDLIKI